MKNEKLGMDPVIPNKKEYIDKNGKYHDIENGISKRLYLAGMILPGVLSNIDFIKVSAETAKDNNTDADVFLIKTVYSLVDELLKQENI